VTGIFTTPTLTYVSSYGRGLWTIDEPWIIRPPIIINLCAIRPILCIIRFPADPEQYVFDPDQWPHRDVIYAVNGRILGIDAADGPIASIDVTPGTLLLRPNAPDAPLPFQVVETEKGRGFYGMKAADAALQKNEVINGLLLSGGKLESLVSMQKPLAKEDLLAGATPKRAPIRRQPRVVLAGNVPGSGIAIVSRDRATIAVTVFDIDPDGAPAIVLVDGVAIDQLPVSPKGVLGVTVKLPPLAIGKHTLEVRQKSGRATSQFLVTDAEDEERSK
ncbi:MAG TPA: hypothetical protein VN605_11660, partial [Thermoanaerobaculia bacterium]|nr:hypothetical protein [Thermoanaerobaculia bacterium]